MKRIKVAGVSYKTADLDVREALAVPRSKLIERLQSIAGGTGCDEVVVLSTCNRVEVYVAGESADPTEALLDGHQVDEACVYRRDGAEAVRHLFRVAASLDSMVPGEAQILGQVRHAYEAARGEGLAGQRLHGLFQRAIKVGREVRTDTGLAAIRRGIAETAAGHAEQVLGSLGGKTLLCVGTGKMNRLLLRHLHARPPGRRPGKIHVVGRDPVKATDLAETFGGTGASLATMPEALAEADLVVCGTGSLRPIVSKAMLAAATSDRPDRPIFVIDVAMPRDVEPGAGALPGVHLYDLDDSAVRRRGLDLGPA